MARRGGEIGLIPGRCGIFVMESSTMFRMLAPTFSDQDGEGVGGSRLHISFWGAMSKFSPLILSFGAKSEQASPHFPAQPSDADLQTGGSVSREPPREAVIAQTVASRTCFGLQRTACDLVGIYPLQSLAWPSIFAGLPVPAPPSLPPPPSALPRKDLVYPKPDTAAIGRALN